MYPCFFVTLSVLFCGTDFVMCKTPGEPSIQNQPLEKINLSTKDSQPVSETWEINPNLNSMWSYRPTAAQSQPEDILVRKIIIKPPQSLTRLAKTYTYGFEPYFAKDFFEPFERRQKPVTLITFRKNGLFPKIRDESTTNQVDKAAELQSPFNEVNSNSYWQEDPSFI